MNFFIIFNQLDHLPLFFGETLTQPIANYLLIASINQLLLKYLQLNLNITTFIFPFVLTVLLYQYLQVPKYSCILLKQFPNHLDELFIKIFPTLTQILQYKVIKILGLPFLIFHQFLFITTLKHLLHLFHEPNNLLSFSKLHHKLIGFQ